jgi:hypothetical protein
MISNALRIPERAVEPQVRLCVDAHCRSARHRAYEATLCAIKENVTWTTMAKDVKVFVQNCLHCVANIPGDKVPRPLGTQLHAAKPNEILQIDFLYIGLSRDGKYLYILLLKNDLSGYLWLVPCRIANAAATVDALTRWFAVFVVVLLWISDRGSHIKSEVVRRVQKELKAKHHFTSKLPVIERHYRVRMQASHTCFPCSAIRAEDVRRRVVRSVQSSIERPEQFFID